MNPRKVSDADPRPAGGAHGELRRRVPTAGDRLEVSSSPPLASPHLRTSLDRLVAPHRRRTGCGSSSASPRARAGRRRRSPTPGVLARTARATPRRPTPALMKPARAALRAEGTRSGRRTPASPGRRCASGRSGTSRPRPWFWSTQPFAHDLREAAQGRLSGHQERPTAAPSSQQEGSSTAPTHPRGGQPEGHLYKAGSQAQLRRRGSAPVHERPALGEAHPVKQIARAGAVASGRSCVATTTTRKRIFPDRGDVAGRGRAISPTAALNGLETDREGPGRPTPRRLGRAGPQEPASARSSAQLFWYTWASDYITGSLRSTQSYPVLRPHAPERSRRIHADAVPRPYCGPPGSALGGLPQVGRECRALPRTLSPPAGAGAHPGVPRRIQAGPDVLPAAAAEDVREGAGDDLDVEPQRPARAVQVVEGSPCPSTGTRLEPRICQGP